MADKIDGLKLGFENLIIELIIPGIRLGAISVEAGRTRLSLTGLDRYFESCHHCFPPYCHAPSLTASPPVALSFKAPHGRRCLSHPQPFTHAKTIIVSQHGCHLHPPWPSFLATEGETTKPHVGKHNASSPLQSCHLILAQMGVWLGRKVKTKWEGKAEQKALCISYYGNLQVFNDFHPSVCLSMSTKDVTKRYKKI